MPCLCSVLPSFARWLCPNWSLFGSMVSFVAALEHLEHFRTNLAHFKNSKFIHFDPTCIFLTFILLFCVCVRIPCCFLCFSCPCLAQVGVCQGEEWLERGLLERKMRVSVKGGGA